MNDLRTAAQQALEALEDFGMKYYENTGEVLHRDVYESLKAALVEDAMQKFTDVSQEIEAALAEPDLSHCPKCGGPADNGHDRSIPPNPYWCTKCMAEPVQKPVAGRAFLERILTAMEGVIDVADRKTDEFDALRSCVIDLTMMLHTAPPQRKPLSEAKIKKLLIESAGMTIQFNDVDLRFARAIERAHGIGGEA